LFFKEVNVLLTKLLKILFDEEVVLAERLLLGAGS
jgi:hypothetical protein